MILWHVEHQIWEERQQENAQQEQQPIGNGCQSSFAQPDFMIGNRNNYGEVQTNGRCHLANLDQDRDDHSQPNWIKSKTSEEWKDDW